MKVLVQLQTAPAVPALDPRAAAAEFASVIGPFEVIEAGRQRTVPAILEQAVVEDRFGRGEFVVLLGLEPNLVEVAEGKVLVQHLGLEPRHGTMIEANRGL